MNVEFDVDCIAHVTETWKLQVPAIFKDWPTQKQHEFLEETMSMEGESGLEFVRESVDEEREREIAPASWVIDE